MRQKTNHIHENIPDFRSGNEIDFDAIFQEFYPVLCYYSFQITSNKPASQDIAEESFIKAWERRETIQDLKAYLYRVVRNASLDWVKAETRRRAAEDGAATMISSSENPAWDALVKAEVLRELYAGISKLPPQRQRVFKMLYQEGKSVMEVAEELKVTTRAIRQHKEEGLIFLRKILPFIFLLLFQYRH